MVIPVEHAQRSSISRSQAQELVLLDSKVADYAVLAAGVRAGVEVVILNSETDGIEQISAILKRRSSITALHLVSHCIPGGIQLGSTLVTLESLSRYSAQLTTWSNALAEGATLLIYGCEVAQTCAGQNLLTVLSELTGAAIAASTTKIGSAALGGNWHLDVTLGTATTALAFRPETLSAYSGVLAPGDLDKTFDADGKVLSNLSKNDNPVVSLTQPDGKVVVVANSGDDMVLARYNADGTLDASFGAAGKATVTGKLASAAALQPDGKIVVTGLGNTLLRVNANGSVDTGFGSNGELTLASPNFFARNLTVQADGKFVLAGSARLSTDPFSFSEFDFAVARFNADGTPDTSFDGDGVVANDFDIGLYSSSSATTLLVQPDGKILAVGQADDTLILARYNSNGSPDTSFSGDGIVSEETGDQYNNLTRSLLLQPDGKILAVGRLEGDFGVARFNADGSLDTSFDGDGVRRIDVGVNVNDGDSAEQAVLQPDGKILLLGRSDGDAAAVRLNANGSTDTTFGNNGKVHIDFGSDEDGAIGGVLQPNGNVLLVGGGGEDNDIALARIQLNDDPNFPVNSAAAEVPLPIDFGGDPGLTLEGINRRDTLKGGKKNDVLDGGAGNDQLKGGNGNDRLLGQAGRDRLEGGGGKDSLDGGAGNDTLLGQGGDDVITGGAGNDTITTGSGKDMIVYTSLSDGTDTITDFNQDLIDLRAIFSQAAFAGPTTAARLSEFVELVQVGANTAVQIDADGSGTGTSFVTLATLTNVVATTLTTQNFLI